MRTVGDGRRLQTRAGGGAGGLGSGASVGHKPSRLEPIKVNRTI